LSDFIARFTNLSEIFSDLRLIVVAAIGVIYVSPEAMIVTALVDTPPLMTTISPPSMFSAATYITPKMMTVPASVIAAPRVIVVPTPSMIPAMVYVTPKVMIITAPMMPLQFAMLAMVPPAILGVGCLGDSWEN
jgi:hypothetical protein